MSKAKVSLFCTIAGKVTPHTVSVNGNGEVDFTCDETGHFVRCHSSDPGEVANFIAKHNEVNSFEPGEGPAPGADDALAKLIESGVVQRVSVAKA